jgi:hypothetical protein
MNPIQKLRNNVFSEQALTVLGPVLYARYVATLAAKLPTIMKAGDFRPLDRAMGRASREFHYRGRTFRFDCRYCDEHLAEDSYGFGIAREIYIRDCYFRWQDPSVFDQARTVVDLGANRGALSTLMTTRARFILSVECGAQYADVIRHNMDENGYTSYAVETAFIGAGGATADSDAPRISMSDLFRRHNIESVDFLKIYIEGSEFALFESAGWLDRVHALSMEVHQGYGDVRALVGALDGHGFTSSRSSTSGTPASFTPGSITEAQPLGGPVPIDDALAARIRPLLAGAAGVVEKKMFGGLAFLVHGNMSVGVHGSELIVRIDPAETDDALEQAGVRVFDLTGRPMKGWLLVSGKALAGRALASWVSRGVAYARSLPPK